MALNRSALKGKKTEEAAAEKKKNITFTFRIAEDELAALQDILDGQPRKKRPTVAGICRKAIADYIEKHGG